MDEAIEMAMGRHGGSTLPTADIMYVAYSIHCRSIIIVLALHALYPLCVKRIFEAPERAL